MSDIRKRLWLWGHDAGSHDADWGLPGPSSITPVEAAHYMGIPNVVMVRYSAASRPPSVQATVPFQSLRQVVWSIVGGAGITARDERDQVIALAPHLPNMTGVMMDDFFKTPKGGENVAALSLDELREVRRKLDSGPRRLDLWVVLYGHKLHLPIRPYLELCDKVTFWTWKAEDLDALERDFDTVEALAPSCGRVLGCYMWDYGNKRPMPVERMARQCEVGLRWLRQGRIEGMIFLASCICDLDLETVEWTRRWVADLEAGGRP